MCDGAVSCATNSEKPPDYNETNRIILRQRNVNFVRMSSAWQQEFWSTNFAKTDTVRQDTTETCIANKKKYGYWTEWSVGADNLRWIYSHAILLKIKLRDIFTWAFFFQYVFVLELSLSHSQLRNIMWQKSKQIGQINDGKINPEWNGSKYRMELDKNEMCATKNGQKNEKYRAKTTGYTKVGQ